MACLDALAAAHLGSCTSLGGAFGLAHYLDYRPTNDIDAWWREEGEGSPARAAVARTVEEALRRFGEVRTRAWGDVVAIELAVGGKTVFGFLVARRSARLANLRESPWPGVRLDDLDDLIASKMAALVERGAPRDLRDIHAICDRGLATADRCWQLWEARQRAAGEDADRRRAEIAIRTHLARLERVRPLEAIAVPAERAAAERVRTWFKRELLRELPD